MNTTTDNQTMTAQVIAYPFNVEVAADKRCDRCGAQAYVFAEIGDQELHFCVHHFNQHEERLLTKAHTIHDHRAQLAGAQV